jgi:carboxylesterase type B
VNIGYRLNWQGFLACQDLIDEAAKEEKSGRQRQPVFNYGLRDQRNAFQWIKNNISGFGGDPDSITAFGESAGSVALAMHLCSDVPLFHRVILQSGTASGIGRSHLPEYEGLYQSLLQYLDIQEDTPSLRLKALRAVPVSRLIDAVKSLGLGAIRPYTGEEADFFPITPTLLNQTELISRCSWVGNIMLGDCFFEGYAFVSALQNADPKKLVSSYKAVLGESSAERVLESYGIDLNGEMDQNLFWMRSMELAADLVFCEGIDAIAKAVSSSKEFPRKVYRYHFILPNPFPGSMYSFVMGHHFVDLFYQFMTLTTRYPTHREKFLERQSVEMARIWIRFGNDMPPWEGGEYDAEHGRIAVCDELRGWQVRTREEDEKISKDDPWGPRRYKQWELLHEVSVEAGEREGPGSKSERADKARRMLIDFPSFQRDGSSTGAPTRY